VGRYVFLISRVLDCVTFLCENGCPSNIDACNRASEYGHLEVLKYLHEVAHAPWSEWSVRGSARNGHLEVLKYLHSEGAPWVSYVPFPDSD
jgi:hypothetical protein